MREDDEFRRRPRVARLGAARGPKLLDQPLRCGVLLRLPRLVVLRPGRAVATAGTAGAGRAARGGRGGCVRRGQEANDCAAKGRQLAQHVGLASPDHDRGLEQCVELCGVREAAHARALLPVRALLAAGRRLVVAVPTGNGRGGWLGDKDGMHGDGEEDRSRSWRRSGQQTQAHERQSRFVGLPPPAAGPQALAAHCTCC